MASPPATTRRELRLRLVCLAPPVADAADFGLQDRQQSLAPGATQPDGALAFDCAVTAMRRDDGTVRLAGPFVHGPAAAPFLYLSLKRREDHATPWLKRLKVPLPVLTWDEIASLSPETALCASVAGTNSGTVPLLGAGWVPDR